MKKDKQKVCDKPVMSNHCKTCPFKLDENGVWQNIELANTVISRNIFKSQQTCHSTRQKNGFDSHRCKGYYDYSFEIYDGIGLNPKDNLLNNPKKIDK